MTLYEFVLFLHIATLGFAFMLSGALHVSAWVVARRAETVADLRVFAKVNALGMGFPVFVILLLLEGMWLLKLSEEPQKYGFGDAFVWSTLIVIAWLFVVGPAVMAPWDKRFGAILEQTPEGPIPPAVHAVLYDRRHAMLASATTGLVYGTVFNMVTKPEAAGALVVLVVGACLGALEGFLLSNKASVHTVASSE